MNFSGKKKILLSVSAIIMILVIVCAFIGLSANDNVTCTGVKAAGVSFGKLTEKQLQEKLDFIDNNINDDVIVFQSNGEDLLEVSIDDFGLQIDNQAIITQLVNASKSDSDWTNLLVKYFGKEVDISLPYSLDKDKCKTIMGEIGKAKGVKKQNAGINVDDNGQITIKEQVNGLIVSEEKFNVAVDNTLKEIWLNTGNQYKQQQNTAATYPLEIEFSEVEPEITTASLTDIDGLLSSFTTEFDSGAENRTHNIKLASAAIDGTILEPGEIFSYNEVVGKRTYEKGYLDAPVIANGQFVDGLAGGICQVSTTLYNAALLADLEIVERYNHALAVSYVPLGLDATVSYGYCDFRFKNNLDKKIYISIMVEGGSITVDLYGNQAYKKDISVSSSVDSVIASSVVYEYDNTMNEGEEVVTQYGRDGYNVSAFKTVKENGEIVRTEELPYSTYDAVNEIITVGTKSASGENDKKSN